MPGRASQSALVERFLDARAASGGLHALLGVPTEGVSEDQIITALERQLGRIDSHAQGRTPEADEVRLALHAAAAQLLSQAAARRKATGGRGVPGPTLAAVTNRAHLLERDALLTLARYGGWNRRSLRRLTMLAMARGARPNEIAGVLQHLAGRRGPARHRRPMPGASPSPAARAQPGAGGAVPEREEEPSTRVGLLVGAIASGLALVVAVALVLVAITGGANAPEPVTEAGEPEPADDPVVARDLPAQGGEELFPWQGEREGAGDTTAESAPARPTFARLSEALTALDSAVDGLAIDPAEAVRVFDGAFAGVGSQWCNLTLSQQRAAQHDVVEFVYRAVQRPELVGPVIEAVARDSDPDAGAGFDAEQIWPRTWSVGMLARLAHERDIAASAARLIETELRGRLGPAGVASGGFAQGTQAALWNLLPVMVRAEQTEQEAERSWEQWIAVARYGEGEGQGAVLAALEWVLTAAPEPSENERARQAIEELTLASRWGEGEPSRAWLVRAFDDDRMTTADLHALTTTLARRSRAPGVDVTMALPVRADATARELLRERYAEVWSLDTAGPALDDLAEDWLAVAGEAIEAAGDSETTLERLAAAVHLSRVSEAAGLRYAGLLDEAGIVIDESDRPVEIELAAWASRQRPDRIDESPAMSDWALRYLSAQRDLGRRLELLNTIASVDIAHPADAEVLVTEAVRGSPAQARAAARSALLAQKPTAVLTLAMLEVLPRMPRTPQNAELVAALTTTASLSTDDPDWSMRSRRVLVQTALEQLAAQGDDGVIDRLAVVLAASYAARATAGATMGGGSEALDLPADQAAALLRLGWERQARRGGIGGGALEVDRVLASHASRLGLARGPVQTFVAEQQTALELMAIAVRAERLDRAAEVSSLLSRVRRERSEADDIFDQILITESAFIELWAMRLGQEAP